MSSQLDLYNGCLLLCGERFLGSLTENREPRRLLDQLWSGQQAVNACLEMGQWNFAMRTVSIDYDPSIAPTFGYRRAFPKPNDWILTSAVSEEEFFRVPLTRYWDEAGVWYADLDTIFVRYVSNDANYGGNLGGWPQSFSDFVSAWMASRIILKLSNDSEEEKVRVAIMQKRLLIAKSRCAMAEPTQFVAQGAWTRARNRFLNRRDNGTTGRLIG